MTTQMDAKTWISTNWPNMKIVDMTVAGPKGYGYPDYVIDHIKTKWKKISDVHGGVYKKPSPEEEKDMSIKNFAKDFQNTRAYQKMDDHNKEAMDVLANEGEEAFMKNIFTDKKTGRALTYGEMRMLYG